MALRIQNNIDALNAYRNLNLVQGTISKSTEKLSSGFRINRAADDASGLVISEQMRLQNNTMKISSRNAQDAISLVQYREGITNELTAMVQRAGELAVQYQNGLLANGGNPEAQAALEAEFTALTDEMTRVLENSNFNKIPLFAAGGGAPVAFQIGAAIDPSDITGVQLSVDAGTDPFDPTNLAISDQSTIATELNALTSFRAVDGALQNKLEHVVKSLDVAVENMTAAESLIRDTDMAAEMVKYTKQNVLAQAGTAMLAQANQSSQGVLSLLR